VMYLADLILQGIQAFVLIHIISTLADGHRISHGVKHEPGIAPIDCLAVHVCCADLRGQRYRHRALDHGNGRLVLSVMI
jgi:hypothetical protein